MHKHKTPGILIFGERNTGTNYLEKLLNLNLIFPDRASPIFKLYRRLPFSIGSSEKLTNLIFAFNYRRDGGWKHAQITPKDIVKLGKKYNLRFITLTKNPYSFCTSLFKNPYHQVEPKSKTIYEFVRSPWTTRAKDRTYEKVLSSPVELWNLKNNSYIQASELDPKIVLNLRWEDLIDNPEKTVKKISEHFGVPLSSKFFTNYTKSTKTNPSTTSYEKYYKDEEWRKELDSATIRLINKKIDPQTAKHFKYKIIRPNS